MTGKNFFYNKKLSVDKFLENVLFDKKKGYYSSKNPFGYRGDFLTAPGVSNLFSEIIGIWFVSSWFTLGKPKHFNIVELGPGDGSLMKTLIKTIERFPDFTKAVNIYLYEKSSFLRKLQKKKIHSPKIKWIKNYHHINKGPIMFFGNEFFDSIPIKQFVNKKGLLMERYFYLKENKIKETFRKASIKDSKQVKKFKSFKNLRFIEYPKLGLKELDKINKKILKLGGGILLIDYGYLVSKNKSTLQSVIKHKKNNLYKNLGKADITYLVNFDFLKEYFTKNNLKLKKVVTQKFFLEKMGIMERANTLSRNMSFKEQSNLYLRLKRLLDLRLMGKLFKVIFAYNYESDKFLGFE